MYYLSFSVAYVGIAVLVAGAAAGTLVILIGIYAALVWAFKLYLRRLNNIYDNWSDMAAWVRAGRPAWTKADDPTNPGSHWYMRMVPQDGTAIDIPEIVPVRVHERLDRALKTAERMIPISEDEEWSYVASYLRDVKDALET